MRNPVYLSLLLLALLCSSASADTILTDDLRIDSQALGYPLQYRVFVPENTPTDAKLPTIYLLDGQWYLAYGKAVDVLKHEIEAGSISPVVAVFIDSRNPDDLQENRRDDEFKCNPRYAAFIAQELIPTISQRFPVSRKRDDRVIGGVSFGGMSAACFGLTAPDAFSGIAMQSPANANQIDVVSKIYKEAPPSPTRFFLSAGTRNDNLSTARELQRTLLRKGYEVRFIEVPRGHNWNNWQPLIDDLLQTFFAPQPGAN